MRLCGALDPSRLLTATEHRTAYLLALNQMLDSWNTERLIIYSVERKEFTLTASLNPHTIGATGDLVVARPITIDHASIIENDIEYQIEILSIERWQEIADKATTTTLPRELFYDPRLDASGLARVYLWPVPSTANTLALYLWTPLTTAITWDDSFLFPPGYERAITYNFALELAPELQREPSPLVFKIAQEAKAQIKSANIVPLYADIDEALLPHGGQYDIYSNR
jgi:hypothetical protein